MKRIIFALPLMLLVAISSANAQRGPMWQAEELNLTDAQQQKLDDLRFQHQKAMIKKKADLQEARLEMRNMMQKVEVDERAVLEKQRRMSALKAEISESRMKHRLEMRKVLTTEQREKLIKMRRDKDGFRRYHRDGERPHYRGKRGDWDGPRSGPGPGKRSR